VIDRNDVLRWSDITLSYKGLMKVDSISAIHLFIILYYYKMW